MAGNPPAGPPSLGPPPLVPSLFARPRPALREVPTDAVPQPEAVLPMANADSPSGTTARIAALREEVAPRHVPMPPADAAMDADATRITRPAAPRLPSHAASAPVPVKPLKAGPMAPQSTIQATEEATDTAWQGWTDRRGSYVAAQRANVPGADHQPGPGRLAPIRARFASLMAKVSDMAQSGPTTHEDDEAPRTRGVAILGLIVMVGFFGGFMAWAVFAPLSEAAIAPGMIKVEGTRRTLQHLEGGMVREILVRDGDVVTEGQVVMRLDDVQSGSALAGLIAQRDAFNAQQARLAAELRRADSITFPPELAASRDPRAMEAVAGQTALFQTRQASLQSQISVLNNRRDQARGTIASAEGQKGGAERQLALLVQEEAMRRGLVRQGLARLPELLALQRQLAATEGLIADLNGQLRRARASVEEAEGQIRQAVDQRLQEANTELREVVARISETQERLRAAADISTRRDIVAPEAGTIVNLRVFNLGAVLRPGDPAMELVPVRDRLIAEVQVQPMDIDVVFTGLPAEIRLPAFKQRLVPFLHGEVTFVAPDVTVDPQTRASHYRAHIRIDADQLARLPAVFLTPGMPVEAHVQLGSRTFWRYITQPVLDSFHRAFQEP